MNFGEGFPQGAIECRIRRRQPDRHVSSNGVREWDELFPFPRRKQFNDAIKVLHESPSLHLASAGAQH